MIELTLFKFAVCLLVVASLGAMLGLAVATVLNARKNVDQTQDIEDMIDEIERLNKARDNSIGTSIAKSLDEDHLI